MASITLLTPIKHIGISVSDLDRSIAFYRQGFDMELVYRGPFGGDKYDRILGLTGARGTIAVVRGTDLDFELFAFDSPQPETKSRDKPVCDHGISHFCLEVSDIDMMHQRLEAAGARFHCPPLDFGDLKASYGRDPDGNVFELVQYIVKPK